MPELSSEQIRWILETMIILILSIAVHEFGHAFIADRLGDRLPRSQGRVTLNPVAHADPIGTLLFPILGLIYSKGTSIGFGWGRPVQVNPIAFTRRWRMRTGHMFVAAAGPGMNLLFGVVLTITLSILLNTGAIQPTHYAAQVITHAVGLNFVLMFFNLIPAPPLDGGAVLEGLLPDSALPAFRSFAVYGPFVLMAFIFIGPLQSLFLKPAMWLQAHLGQLVGIDWWKWLAP